MATAKLWQITQASLFFRGMSPGSNIRLVQHVFDGNHDTQMVSSWIGTPFSHR